MKRITWDEAVTLSGLPDCLKREYPALWYHEKVGVCGLSRLLFHWTVHIGTNAYGYSSRYCYATNFIAECAMDEWDPSAEGQADPKYWHKHPETGRRQSSFEFRGCMIRVNHGAITSIERIRAGEDMLL